MVSDERMLEFEQRVKASPSHVYYAFTNASAIRDWFCNGMQADITEDGRLHCGRLYFWWSDGFYVSGEFTALKENKAIEYTWNGRGDPGPTAVSISLKADGDGTLVTLKHGGFGSGDHWDALIEETEKRWTEGLENLAVALETGIDLREARRPMLGLMSPGPVTEESAALYNLPKDARGTVVGAVVPGTGAEAAGLQSNDVIHSLNGVVMDGSSAHRQMLAGKRAGDSIEIVYSRDGEQHTIQMELSAFPMVDVPATAQELAQAVKANYAQINADLDEILAGISEVEASYRPGEGKWSAKDVLAHLIDTERYYISTWITVLVSGWDMVGWPGNVQARIDALLVVYPTLDDLRAELSRCHTETIELIARLPGEFVNRRRSAYRRVGQLVLQTMHSQLHYAQIREAIQAARASLRMESET